MWTCGSTSGDDRSRPPASSSGRPSASTEPAGPMAAIVSPSTRRSLRPSPRDVVGWTLALRTIRPVGATQAPRLDGGPIGRGAIDGEEAERSVRLAERGRQARRVLRDASAGLDPFDLEVVDGVAR